MNITSNDYESFDCFNDDDSSPNIFRRAFMYSFSRSSSDLTGGVGILRGDNPAEAGFDGRFKILIF